MARKAKVWFREATGWYMTSYRGKQVRLSRDKKEAERAFHTLLAQDEPAEETKGYRPSFRMLADLFLREAERTKAPMTVAVQTVYLQSFCDHVRGRKAADLKVFHATEWINAHPEWGESTRTTARSILRACLNWSVNQGYLAANPLAKLKRGEFTRRERILSAEEKGRIRAWLPEGIREFIFALEQTGARPFSELARVTAEMIDFRLGAVTFKKHKNAKKGKRRVIYLSDPLAELLARLAAERPHGLLFTTKLGNPWNNGNVMKWMRKIEAALAIPRLSAYTWRHTLITECLAKGMSADIVAELVGNSPSTIHRYYSHLDQKHDVLRDAARRAVG